MATEVEHDPRRTFGSMGVEIEKDLKDIAAVYEDLKQKIGDLERERRKVRSSVAERGTGRRTGRHFSILSTDWGISDRPTGLNWECRDLPA